MKKIFIGLLIAVLAVWGFAHFGQNAQAQEQIDLTGLFGRIVQTVQTFIDEEVATRVDRGLENLKKLGAVVGPQLFSEFWEVNGVKEYRFEQAMTTATTSVCTFTPPTATTTLTLPQGFNANFARGTPTSTFRAQLFMTSDRGATSTVEALGSASSTVQSSNGLIILRSTSSVATTVPGYLGIGDDRRIMFFLGEGTGQLPSGSSGTCRLRLDEIE